MQFDHFRAHLDDYNDTRERLIKLTLSCALQASRDVTIIAKRTIFLIHRIAIDDDDDAPLRAATSAQKKLLEVHAIYAKLKPDLIGDRFWRYHRQVSPGLQEYIEALSFAHYLQHHTLITFSQVQKSLCDPDGAPVRIRITPPA
ncbi:hypothetical protein H0H81_005546 [Sphagnurus paluster]|uniref:Uncharacterized protein n=1 Tax=Sphagnurus paluster TaxID=117069 RepID=A0A9P7KH61_9AGAR|nr:hypothetical protein H0H81_005546 [Sphagnurus paluster]